MANVYFLCHCTTKSFPLSLMLEIDDIADRFIYFVHDGSNRAEEDIAELHSGFHKGFY